jgi:nucleolar protein 58
VNYGLIFPSFSIKLKAFHKFDNTTDALSAATAISEGKLGKDLKKFLSKTMVKKGLQDELAVYDAKLGGLIKEKLGIACIYDKRTMELMRGIRSQLDTLLSGISAADMNAMVLGLSHSLSRYRLKFSSDKVDTMIVQAVGLLEDLDKEINVYAMRLREWYGWHFPELTKLVAEHVVYAKIVKAIGFRNGVYTADLSDVADEHLIKDLQDAAAISMGTEVTETDINHIHALCDQIKQLSDYRSSLFNYLSNRMQAIAPNLCVLVGETVGARLIAHAGSLLNLAKQPASTVQILGAEKALFRALKTKHDTPKYGLIYHASLIGSAKPKHKGKISRLLAAKISLSVRVDALSEESSREVGLEGRAKVEQRLNQLEEAAAGGVGSGRKQSLSRPKKEMPAFQKADHNSGKGTFNASNDSTFGAMKQGEQQASVDETPKSDKKDKKDKKRKERDSEDEGKSEKKKKKEKSEKKEKKEKSGDKSEKKKKKKSSKHDDSSSDEEE